MACLLVCLYWPEIFCVQGLVLSARMYVMVFQDKHTLPKWNILSLLCTSKQLDRICYFKSNQIDSVIKWVSWFQVFCKEIKSNAVSKLFILVWRYEGMKVLDLGYENFSITPICHIFSNFPAVFHHAQVTNRQVLKHGFTQLRRTAHIPNTNWIFARRRDRADHVVNIMSFHGNKI